MTNSDAAAWSAIETLRAFGPALSTKLYRRHGREPADAKCCFTEALARYLPERHYAGGLGKHTAVIQSPGEAPVVIASSTAIR